MNLIITPPNRDVLLILEEIYRLNFNTVNGGLSKLNAVILVCQLDYLVRK